MYAPESIPLRPMEPMQLIDTHAHLYANAFQSDREAMLARARASGVELILLPNVDSESIPAMLDLEAGHPDFCLAMMGLHPTSVKEDFETELAQVRRYLEARPWVAVGEIGIDLYWDKTFFEQQKAAFLRQVEWAVEFDRPIVIHSRESIDILIDVLRQVQEPRLRGVFHCFTGTGQQAAAIVELGFYLGIGGVVTYKNSTLGESLQNIPLERLVLETDAPYLAPVPYRGKRNESSYLPTVAQKLAEITGMDPAVLARRTSENARVLFEPERFVRNA